MSRFFESIAIKDGAWPYLQWHQQRVNLVFGQFYPHLTPFILEEVLQDYDIPENGLYKCRILFDQDVHEISMVPYRRKNIQSLRLMEVPEGYGYPFKFTDRRVIDDWVAKKGDADDILMTRDGWITDTSIANIAFRKEDRWYTPSPPLLAGTTWKRLISKGKLIPRPIHKTEIHQLDGFRVFNALNDWGELEEGDCGKIL